LAQSATLEITATGQKNVRSHGSEVWLCHLRQADGENVSIHAMKWESGWELRENGENGVRLCSHIHQPARLRWKGEVAGPLRLAFVSHPWSGVVQVRFNGVRRLIDLYGQGGEKSLILDPANPSAFAPDTTQLDERIYQSKPPSLWDFANPLTLARNLWSKRMLVWQFALRDVQGRYRGSYLGIFWSLLTPLMLLAVYTIIFSGLMPRGGFDSIQKMANIPPGNAAVFPVILFSGLIVFNIFSECINKSPGLITHNPNYVKRIIFPVEVLPFSILLSCLIHALISFSLLFLGSVLFLHRLYWTWLLLPLALLPLLMMTTGLSWFLSSLGVFVRDIGNIVSVAVSALFFLSAVFFSVDDMKHGLATYIVRANPVASVIDDVRRVLFGGAMPQWDRWAMLMLLGLLMMQAGYVWFMKSKRWFSDVL